MPLSNDCSSFKQRTPQSEALSEYLGDYDSDGESSFQSDVPDSLSIFIANMEVRIGDKTSTLQLR